MRSAPLMKNALIFDLDGTLADTMPAHYRAWQEVLAPAGIAFSEELFYSWGGRPTVQIARTLVTDACSAVDYYDLAKAKEQAFVTKMPEILPVTKVLEIARAARGKTPMAVASGGYRRVVEQTLRHLDIFDWFGAIVTAEDTKRHKPDPDVFLEAARRLDVAPAICIVYEDTDLGVEAAQRAGMQWVDVRKL